MQYKVDAVNLEDITDYDSIYIELRETAILFPWGNDRDRYYLQDDIFTTLTGSNLIYHNIRYDIDDSMPQTRREIKKILEERYLLSREIATILYNQEIEIEIKHVKARKYVWEIYQLLKRKKIYFVIEDCDIVDQAEKILQKCGYDSYTSVLYSREITDRIDKDKNEKTLFIGRKKYVDLPDYGFVFIPETEDVFSGGYHNAVKPQNALKRAAGNMQYVPWINRVPGYSIMNRMVANKFFDNPFVEWKEMTEFNADPYFVGYYALGMHIAGIVKWIAQKCIKEQYNRILFCARDGFVIKKAYDIYCKYNKKLPKSEYIQGSRKFLMPQLLKSERDFYDIPGAIYYTYSPYRVILLLWVFTKYAPVNDFNHEKYIEQENEIRDYIQNEGFEYYRKFSSKEEMNSFISVFLKKFYSVKNHNTLRKNLEKYYTKYGKGDVLFDTGYSGKLPKAIIESSSGIEDVLYIYTDDDSCELLQREGKFHIDTFYNYRPAVDNVIREYIISENNPSCIGLVSQFKDTKETMVPVFENQKDYCKSKVILQIQEAAIDFIRNLYEEFGEEWEKIPFTGRETSLPFEGFIRHINDYDLEMFKDTYQEDYYKGMKSDLNWRDFYKKIMNVFEQ